MIKIGNLDIDKLYLGTSDNVKVYLGDVKLYPSEQPSFNGKWLATYTGGTTYSAECDSTSAITQNEIPFTFLESVEIGDCVTSIGTNAFSNCTSLTSITIPNSVTSIGGNAFDYCTSLTSCTIGSGVTSIGNNVFYGCSSLTSCTIGSGVTSIGESAFYGCTSLTSITINATTPPSVGWGTFQDSYPIYVPASAVEAYKSANVWANIYASRIQAIPSPSFNGKWLATYTGGTTSSAECDSTSAISQNEITLTDLESVEIGNCVTSIARVAFNGCSSLTSIDIPDSVTSISEFAFNNCSGLTSCTLSNNITTIANYVFQGCNSLTSITMPNSVTTIGRNAFTGCRSLTSVVIPNSVTSIGDAVFYGCTGLTSCTLSNNITSIGGHTFRDCSSLTSIDIPNSVTSIGEQSFIDCTNLRSITVNAVTPPTLGNWAFNSTNNCPIYVPAASVDTYKAASGWSTYASRIQAIP